MAAELHGLHRTWTLADIAQLPADGWHYEIIEGQLVVTPPPDVQHQHLADELRAYWRAQGYRCVTAVGVAMPAGWTGRESYVIPDVVAYRESVDHRTAKHLRPEDLLAVAEVHSGATWRRDLNDKMSIYADMGVETYVLIDPQAQRVTTLRLTDGRYTEDVHSPLTWELLDV